MFDPSKLVEDIKGMLFLNKGGFSYNTFAESSFSLKDVWESFNLVDCDSCSFIFLISVFSDSLNLDYSDSCSFIFLIAFS